MPQLFLIVKQFFHLKYEKFSRINYKHQHWLKNNYAMQSFYVFNPIPAGVLENQDMLGGGVNLTPPSKSHV